ncbi:MAG TPA: cyclopropane-fatty-acyl-phospholipid synthase family protein, partial [Caulobacteraceae bacterium]
DRLALPKLKGGGFARLFARGLALASRGWRGEGLVFQIPGGQALHVGPTTPASPRLVLHDWSFARKVLLHGDIGLAEAYIDGRWDCADLARVLAALADNFEALGRLTGGTGLARAADRLLHRLGKLNTRGGAKRNIAAHYDLGNDFYQGWLDPSMTYSSALWGSPDLTLEQAQAAKYRALAEALGLRPEHRVLEIGCGWGGFAEFAAREVGCHITALTISRAQHAFAVERMARQGLSDRVEVRLVDYRQVEGRFDRIVSIEMVEAVGEAWWPAYFGALHDRLEPGGLAGLQAITIRDDLFDAYRRRVDFIQRYIFPGGMLLSEARLNAEAERAGLAARPPRRFGKDYARTLNLWAERFMKARTGDDRFDRLWRFYLAYCEAGFATGRTEVVQVVLARR